MLLGGCSSFPKCHDSLLPSVIGLFHKVWLNRSVSIPMRCVGITYKIQMNKLADTSINRADQKATSGSMCLPVTSEGDKLINSCATYREENCNLLNPLGYKGPKLDFENLLERDTVRKQLLILMSSVNASKRKLLTELCLFWERLLAVLLPMC